MEVRTPASLHLPKRVPVKNAPDFAYPNKDTPKTCPVLYPNLRRGTFWGRMQYAPTRIRQKRTRFHYPQLRVREKPGRFHISTPGCTQNLPSFPLPNKDTPKTRLVLAANSCRRIFGGVCNTPLHRYAQNLAGFIFPHPDTPKTHPISSFPIRIHRKRTRF